MPFQAGWVQADSVQAVVSSPKVYRPVQPFPPATVFVRLTGPFLDHTVSAIRTRQSTKKIMLRFRFDVNVVVTVQRRLLSHWMNTVYTGRDMQHLFSVAIGEEVRLIVDGTATGVAELVDGTVGA